MQSALPTSSTAFSGSPDRLEVRDLASLHRDVWRVMWAHPLTFMVLPAVVYAPLDLIGALPLPAAAHNVAQVAITAWLTTMLLAALRQMGQGQSPTWSSSAAESKTSGKLFSTLFVTNLLTGLATLLLIVPGFVLGARWLLVGPAFFFEGKTGREARARSSALIAERGTARVIGYIFAIGLAWVAIGLVPAFTGPLFVSHPVGSIVVAVISGIPLSIVCGGLIVGAGLLYLDLAGVSAQQPVGLELRTPDGARLAPPRSSGRAGVVAAGVVGVVALFIALPCALIPAWIALEPEDAWELLSQSPLAVELFYQEAEVDGMS